MPNCCPMAERALATPSMRSRTSAVATGGPVGWQSRPTVGRGIARQPVGLPRRRGLSPESGRCPGARQHRDDLGVVVGADAGDSACRSRHVGSDRRPRRHRGDSGGDEDGASAARATRWRGEGRSLPARRARAAWRAARGDRVTDTRFPRHVTVVEVGPRDGLQNEAAILPSATKIAFIEALADAGLPVVEMTAFVSPKWVPQMADAVDVARAVARRAGTRYSGARAQPHRTRRAPSTRALTRSQSSLRRPRRSAAGTSIRAIEESLAAYADVAARRATRRHARPRLSVDGVRLPVRRRGPGRARRRRRGTAARDGMRRSGRQRHDRRGDPRPGASTSSRPLPGACRGRGSRCTFTTRAAPRSPTSTRRSSRGIAIFDSSAGGLGGCPYAPGAAGNLSTEDLIYLLDGLGIETGVSIDGVVKASSLIAPHIGHPLPSRYYQAARATASP